MPTHLTDAEVADIRAAVTEGGQSLQDIADRFGTSRQHVSRLARGEQRAELGDLSPVVAGPSVTSAVHSLFEDLGIDPMFDVTAAASIALAEKLDAVRASQTAQSAMAAPALAKTLQEMLVDLRAVEGAVPRLGGLRGDEAVLVARELGIDDPESVNIERFDAIEVIRLQRARRRAQFQGAS
jgi:transcriptional regulator with XRE-family HTH domain